MNKSLVLLAAALVILSAGSSNRAQAGASASAPTKYRGELCRISSVDGVAAHPPCDRHLGILFEQ